jgi:hypothetical protein
VSKENACVKVTVVAPIESLITFLVFPFSVSQKVNLLNQLHNGTATMNNQRTLEIIRDDLTSSSMVESEGTYWDSRHPHLFVVMGASVSLTYENNERSIHLTLNDSCFCMF